MMLQCPDCRGPLVDDFGLVECSHCGAGLYVEFDGKVRHRQQGEEASIGAKSKASEKAPPDLTLDGDGYDNSGEASLLIPIGLSADVINTDLPGTMVIPPTEESHVMTSLSNEEESPSVPIVNFPAEEIPLTPAPEVYSSGTAESGEDGDLSDLNAFANSELSGAREGAYLYDLTFSGIDTGDLRQAVKDALTDRLFLWDVESLLRNVRSGELMLRDVTPVKAAILVARISALPIQIRWVQHAVSQS